MTKRHRTTLGETLDHFAGESRDTGEFKAFGNVSALLAPLTIDVSLLATQITLVLEVRLDAREVERRVVRIEVQGDLTLRQERLEFDFWLLQRTGCRNFDPQDIDAGGLDRHPVPFEA